MQVWIVLGSEIDSSSEVLGVFATPEAANACEAEYDAKGNRHYFVDVQGPFELELPTFPLEELK